MDYPAADPAALEAMRRLLTDQDICVLATVSEDGVPHCSLMAYVADDAGRTLWFLTERRSAKFRNLTANPAVSLLVDSRGLQDRAHTQALTVTGRAEVLDPDACHLATAALVRRHPHIAPLTERDDHEVVEIAIGSLLLLDGVKDASFVQLADGKS